MRVDKICFGCMNEIENPNQPCPICGYNKRDERRALKSRALKPGTIIGKNYLLGRVLGVGGFGITYLAKNLKTGRTLAIKEYFQSEFAYRDVEADGKNVSAEGSQKRRFFEIGLSHFEKEAKNLLLFRDLDGIVKVESYFRENMTAYIAMQYVNGMSLKAYLKKRGKPLSEKQVLKMMKPVLGALEKVHQKGMIHRDISPENLILERTGKVTLIDFGAARMATGNETKSLTILLKHGYAPVEQYQSKGRQGPWTDVYALCATMYELLSCKMPENATNRLRKDQMPTLSELAKHDGQMRVSDSLSSVIEKGMAIKQENRYDSIGSLARALYKREDWRQYYTKSGNLTGNPFATERGSTLKPEKTAKNIGNGTRINEKKTPQEQFLEEQKRRYMIEREKEREKLWQQKKEREKQLKFQEEYRKRQEYQRQKELERKREEEKYKKEQEYLKKEYERQEREKREQRQLEEAKKREQAQKREKIVIAPKDIPSSKIASSNHQTPSQSSLDEPVLNQDGRYPTLETVKSTNSDLWYNPYEQEGVDKDVSRKRKFLLFFGIITLLICAGIIFMLWYTSGDTYVNFGTYPQSEIKGSAITKEIKGAEYDRQRFATVNGKRYRKSGPYFYVFDNIKWRVLERKDGQVLLISDCILDAIIFSRKNEVISDWKNSFIREWLNDYFYNAAFTEEEKNAIIKSKIETDGEETEDKVFLLSTEDVTNRSLYFTNDSERVAKQTIYAVRRGAQTGDESAGRWWLRTHGTRENTVQVVRANGSLAENSYTVMSNDCGVRPAIWVDESYFDK